MARQTNDDRHDWVPYLKPTEADHAAAALLSKATIADRIQATIRHPAYAKDVIKYLSKSKRTHLVKSQIVDVFWEPHSPIAEQWGLPATIVNQRQADKLREYYKDRLWRSSNPIRIIGVQPRFILLSVDLSETAKRLQDLLRLLVDQYQMDLGWAQPKRNRSFKCDPFEIYDLVEGKKLSLPKAAQKALGRAFPSGEGPAYSDETKRIYQQAKRAYKWAKSLIAQVGKEAGH
ncbi:MAG: hypothetical protein KF876_11040 [Nitrospira sp.]|nr:hypothetical protein [Nitrospira sp.]